MMELRLPTLEQLRTVYDADLQGAFPAAELKPLQNMEELWEAERYRPVSYTHLDVYKRQALTHLPRHAKIHNRMQ